MKLLSLAFLTWQLCGLTQASRADPFKLLNTWAFGQYEALEIPAPCQGVDCPPYTVLNASTAYEIRAYLPGTWVTTKVDGLLYAPSVAQGFGRLYQYLQGKNEDGIKLNLTAPMLVRVVPGQGLFAKSAFYTYLRLPEKYQETPPKPLSGDVKIFHDPGATVFVHSFGGFMVDELTLHSQIKTLQAAVAANGASWDSSFFFTAAYDGPTKLTGRRNEVMLGVTAV